METDVSDPSNGIIVNPCKHGTVDVQKDTSSWKQNQYRVNAVPDDGFYTSKLTAVDENGNSVVQSEGENYIVILDQKCSITVDAEFACIDPAIYTNSKNGHIAVKVNGEETDEVKPGDTVELEFIPDRGYQFAKDMYFVCEEQPEVEWDGNICTFIMPGCGDLGVYASFGWLMKRRIFLRDNDEGTEIHSFVEGIETSEAYAGDEVDLRASAAEGNEITGIRGENHITGETIFETDQEEAAFIMQDSDVDIYVFTRNNTHSIAIDNSSAEHYTVDLLDESGEEMKEFHSGNRVHAVPVNHDGNYTLSEKISAKTANGIDVDVEYSGEDFYFTMPKDDVVISLSEGIQYIDENGATCACTDYQFLSEVFDQEGVTLSSGWYVAVGANWGFNNRVTINGDVNIILTDNCGVIFNRGIQNNTYGNLSIWGGQEGNGQMACIQAFETSGGNAGIGGDSGTSGGTFNLYGGMVTANAQDNGAGIGGGQYGDGGTINIYGGTVWATGGAGYAGGAGIGGGEDSSGGDIHIYGGTVTATGGNGSYGAAAGIGGGDEGNGGTITISGGDITATGANWGAGIGGGNKMDGGTITIDGGTVRAYGNKGGAGIGGGDDGESGTIHINGGVINAKGDNGGAGIGGGDDGNCSSIVINGGTIDAEGSLAIGPGDGGTMRQLRLDDHMNMVGVLYGHRYEALQSATHAQLFWSEEVPEKTFSYVDEDGTQLYVKNYTDLSFLRDVEGIVIKEGWYAVTQNMTIENRVRIEGNVHLILADCTEAQFMKGICVQENEGTLTIWGQSFTEHCGKLYCHGTDNNAAIGGNAEHDCGVINIHSGNVHAESEKNSAGIGGGQYGDGGSVNIYGGTVYAVGGSGQASGAGIGGGEDSDGGTIRIFGGDVVAVGGNGSFGASAGIGGGDEGSGKIILITGGTVRANGGNWAAGIGGGNKGTGGSIKIQGGQIYANGSRGGAGIGGGDGADSGRIEINGGMIEAHGSLGIGSGDGGKVGTIVLGERMFMENCDYDDRYSKLAVLSDVWMYERSIDSAFENES